MLRSTVRAVSETFVRKANGVAKANAKAPRSLVGRASLDSSDGRITVNRIVSYSERHLARGYFYLNERAFLEPCDLKPLPAQANHGDTGAVLKAISHS